MSTAELPPEVAAWLENPPTAEEMVKGQRQEAEDLIRKLRELGAQSRVIDADEFWAVSNRASRVYGPWLLLETALCRVVSDQTLAEVIGEVWSTAEYPQRALRLVDWLWLFGKAGYTHDGKPASRPTASVTLYRGAPPQYCRRMSWTSDRAVAERFALNGMRGRHRGFVYQTEAPPTALLCFNGENNGCDESEYVINPAGLKITRAR